MNIKHTIKITLNPTENEAYNITCDWLADLMYSPEATKDIRGVVRKAWDALSDLDDFLIVEG